MAIDGGAAGRVGEVGRVGYYKLMPKVSFFLSQEQIDRLIEIGNANVRSADQQAMAFVLEALGSKAEARSIAKKTTIIQMLPANDWHALIGLIDIERYARERRCYYQHTAFVPLVAWALVEDGNRQFVTGIIVDENDIDIVPLRGPSNSGLIGYFQSMPDKETIKEGLEFLQELNDDRASD